MKRQPPLKNGSDGSRTATITPPSPGQARDQSKPSTASVEQVKRRAYEIYLQRVSAGKPGDAASDWAQAERELRR